MNVNVGSLIKSKYKLYGIEGQLCKKNEKGFIYEILPDDSWCIIFQSGSHDVFFTDYDKENYIKILSQQIPHSEFKNQKFDSLISKIKNNHFIPLKRKRKS